MTHRILLRTFLVSLMGLGINAGSTPADVSHARIVRLSVVEGDVRVARDVRGQDPLADSSLLWDRAQLNLPIRQGYVVATDSGRAAVEFENGAMAFLSDNTVLEFYDLSLEDGAMSTRLVLRQGSASFYVNPRSGDYFSVTGGDFTAEATSRAEFRMDNFDDGSTVGVSKGRINVLHGKQSTLLSKNDSLSVKAGDASVAVGRLGDSDDFDRWVDGRIDSVTTASNAAMQYTNSASYTSGYADLMTYGSWFPVGGYGFGWRPYGYGFGWSPFDCGDWFLDPFWGWTFLGAQPWGWLPYHYGGWIFEPGIGWVWIPGYGGLWRPSTGVFVRGRAGVLGVVPIHPLDVRGKTPLNLTKGVFPVNGGRLGALQPAGGEPWKVVKSIPRDSLTSNMIRSTPPERLSRTLIAGPTSNRVVTLGHDTSITYDAREHKFVNSDAMPSTTAKTSAVAERRKGESVVSSTGAANTERAPTASASMRGPKAPPPPARVITPPPAPRSFGGGSYSGGSRAGSGGGARSSIAHPSSSSGSGAGASHPSSGGRPH
jgi:hypothetical protein